MDIIYLLIPLALVLITIAAAAFIWAVRNEQFDDLDRESQRILFEEDEPATPSETPDTTPTKD